MQNHKAIPIIIGMLLLIVGSAAYAALPPRISWTPAQLSPTSTAPGTSISYTIVLKHTGILPILATNQLRIVAEGDIAPFVTITQPKFPPIFKRGNQVSFLITISVPVTSPGGVKNGNLLLKRIWSGKELEVWRADPLPIVLNVVLPTTTTPAGVTFSYPGTFFLYQQLNELTKTVTLTNFGGTYESGGLIPIGGSDIVVAALPPLTQGIDTFLMEKLSTATIESQETILVDGHEATRVIYTETFAPTFSMRYVEVYIPMPQALHKFSLAYNLDDPHEQNFLSEFEMLLNSILLPQ